MVLDADVTFWKQRPRKVKSRDARAARRGEKCNFHPIGGSVEPAYGGSGPGNATPPGVGRVAWPSLDVGETQLTLNEKPRVFRNGDGETRPLISPNRFHQACVQKDDLACAEQLYAAALGALSMKLDCDVQTVSKWADRNYVTTGK